MFHSVVILGILVELYPMDSDKYGVRINNGYYNWNVCQKEAILKSGELLKEIFSLEVEKKLKEYNKTLNKIKQLK